MNQNLLSLLALAQIVGGLTAFVCIGKAVESAVNKEYRRLFWLVPMSVLLWIFCVGLETRYLALLGLLVVGSWGGAVWQRRRRRGEG